LNATNKAVVVGPVISQLTNPFERANVSDVSKHQFLDNIFGVDVNNDEGINGHLLLLGQRLSHKLH